MTLIYEINLDISSVYLRIKKWTIQVKEIRNLAPEQHTQTLFCSCDLEFDPMTLVYEPYLDILKYQQWTF